MRSKIAPILEEARRGRPVYVEPFGGSAAMLLALEPVKNEVYNDADGRLADFFRALADGEAFAKMKRWADTFPQSREIYDEMKRDWVKSPELAKRGFATFYVQAFSFGGKPFNSFGVERRDGTKQNVGAYRAKGARLDEYAARFRFTCVESLDWLQCVAKYDSEQAFFYVDPPYICNSNSYKKDLAPVDHAELVARLLTLQGGAALSCYDNDVYKPLADAGWARHDFAASSSVRLATDNKGDARRRVETLYVKPAL